MGGAQWRVGHVGRDSMYYEELRDGVWQRIDISGELLTGRVSHDLHAESDERWREYPEWARHRRDEILARVMSEHLEPQYDRVDRSARAVGPSDALHPDTVPVEHAERLRTPNAPSHSVAGGAAWQTRVGTAAMTLVIGSLIALGMGWMVLAE